jgi:hypothetical protein
MSPRSGRPTEDERGIALVTAILVLLVISVLAAVLMMNVTVERKIAGRDLRAAQALNTAEAGVGEALSRIRNGDITLVPGNPRSVAQIFLASAGSVPVLGTDSIALDTRQPAGQWLSYSTPNKSADVLTVHFKTDGSRSVIYRYDNTKTPAINTSTGLPIYVISATGREGPDKRRIVAEVIQKPFNTNIKASVAANVDIRFIGNGVVCGYNHNENTPAPSGMNGRLVAPDCSPYETGTGNLPGSWTTQATWNGGGAAQSGNPANVSGQSGFYAGPWEALGLSQAEFYAWVGTPLSAAPASLDGITYLDNNGVAQDQSAAIGLQGVTGEGLLYVDGNLTLNSSFTYRGLIYVEGDLIINGQAWVLGGVIVRGKTELMHTGGATVLYSGPTITQVLAKYGGQFVTLSWREY